MAKVAYSKLNCKLNTEIKTVEVADVAIDVRQYLPIQEKLALIGRVIELAHEQDANYSNPVKADVYMLMEMVFAYTNITFTDKQQEEFLKTYDLLKSNKFFENFYNHMKNDEYNQLKEWIIDALTHIYQYNNSLMGMLENSQTNFDNLNLDAEEIRSKLADPENLTLLKQIAPLMNLAD